MAATQTLPTTTDKTAERASTDLVQGLVSWLHRIAESGRQTDREDTGGYIRLNALHALWGIRIDSGQWIAITNLDQIPVLLLHHPHAEFITVAKVNEP